MVNQTKVDPPSLGALVRDVPARLSEAVLRGLSKDPTDRFESCSALAREVLADVPPLGPGRTLVEPRRRSRRPRKGTPGRVPCPACGGLLPVVREHAGRRVTCTRCRADGPRADLGGAGEGTVHAPPDRPAPPVGRDRPVDDARALRSRRPDDGIPADRGGVRRPAPGSKGPGAGRRVWLAIGLVGLVGLAMFGSWFLGSWRASPRISKGVRAKGSLVETSPVELKSPTGPRRRSG